MLERINLGQALALLQQGKSLDAYAIVLTDYPITPTDISNLRAAGLDIPQQSIAAHKSSDKQKNPYNEER